MKRLLITITILTLLAIPHFSFGSDLEEFKDSVERYYQAYNSMDADTITEMVHPGSVMIESDSPFPSVNPTVDSSKKSLKGWFSTLESLNFVKFYPQYKVVGNTGVMWGIVRNRIKRKGDSVEISYVRVTMTFVKSQGKWLLLMNHFSKFPLDELK